MKAGIAIDDWKLPIFERHLSEAGYVYTKHPGITPGTLLLKVDCDSVEAVHAMEPVVRAANAAAAGTLTAAAAGVKP